RSFPPRARRRLSVLRPGRRVLDAPLAARSAAAEGRRSGVRPARTSRPRRPSPRAPPPARDRASRQRPVVVSVASGRGQPPRSPLDRSRSAVKAPRALIVYGGSRTRIRAVGFRVSLQGRQRDLPATRDDRVVAPPARGRLVPFLAHVQLAAIAL